MNRNQLQLARGRLAIESRYDEQELIRVGDWTPVKLADPRSKNLRRDWTAAQKRRIRHKINKLKKKLEI